jgi:glycerate 2-kinase
VSGVEGPASAVGGQVIVAPDKFKSSLTAVEAAKHIAAGLRRHTPGLDLRLAPVADGGEGTVAAAAEAGFEIVSARVCGPTGRPVDAVFARRGDEAVVELAEVSGMQRLPAGRRDPLGATSRGTGELIRAALDQGCRRIVLGVGGSASTDGGAGMLQALGARLLDGQGHALTAGGAALADLRSVVIDDLDPRLRRTTFVLASDVDNPLLGPTGAARVFARQKGADDEEVDELEAALANWAQVLTTATGRDERDAPGAGAAGGVGFAAISLLDARRRPGIDVVLDLIEFDDLLPGAALVVTGEGWLDRQSLAGKAPIGVARRAAMAGVPTVAVVGQRSVGSDLLWPLGIEAAYPLTRLEPDVEVCLRDAGRLLEQLAETVVAPAWLAPDRA